MFELLFAWAIFTAVLGKSAEAVTHAWKGTAPPGHLRKMARIRAKEAASLREGQQPAGPARTWARTVWGDAWNAATERHAERWPAKSAKKAEYARQRWSWWDGVEEESGRRWDERRARRQTEKAPDPGADPKGSKADREERAQGRAGEQTGRERFGAWESPDRYGLLLPWEELTDAERELWRLENDTDPERRADEAGRRGHLSGLRDRARQRWTQASKKEKGGGGSPSDTPDSTPKPPGQGTNEGVRAPRTPGQVPVSGAGTTTEGSDDMAEVMNLSGATKFTRALNKSYNASVQQLEEVMAWLHSQNIRDGNLHDRFQAILRTTADTAEMTKQALSTCEDQLKVRDAIEAAGGVALTKDALLKE